MLKIIIAVVVIAIGATYYLTRPEPTPSERFDQAMDEAGDALGDAGDAIADGVSEATEEK